MGGFGMTQWVEAERSLESLVKSVFRNMTPFEEL
jgi:hypothetical protein